MFRCLNKSAFLFLLTFALPVWAQGMPGVVTAPGGKNYLSLAGSATGSPVTINALGGDTDVGITLTPKGSGVNTLSGSVASPYFNASTVASGYQLNAANGLSCPANDTTACATLAIGTSAGANLPASAAYNSVYIGYQSGLGSGSTTTGAIKNTGVGYTTLKALTSGNKNVAVGYQAGLAVTSGGSNVFIGNDAGKGTTTASNIMGIGSQACEAVTTTSNACTAIGALSLASATGLGNVGIGTSSGLYVSSGTHNTAIGYLAMQGITGTRITGAGNTAIGSNALLVAQGAAAGNTAIGYLAGDDVTTGTNNLILGAGVASTTLQTGSSNILIGASSAIDTPASSTSNILVIGNNATTPVISATEINSVPVINFAGATSVTGLSALVGTTQQQMAATNTTQWGQFTNSAFGPALMLYKSRGTTVGSMTIVQASDAVGAIWFGGANGTTFDYLGGINMIVDGTPGASADMPGKMQFYTTPNGSATTAVRMIIDNAGIITMPAYGAGAATFDSAGVISSASDARLKIQMGAFERTVDDFKPMRYKWKDKPHDTDGLYAGFIAQNVAATCPECVGKNPDGYLTLQDRAVLAAAVNTINRQQGRIVWMQYGMLALLVMFGVSFIPRKRRA